MCYVHYTKHYRHYCLWIFSWKLYYVYYDAKKIAYFIYFYVLSLPSATYRSPENQMKTKAHKSCIVIITFFERKPLISSFNQIVTSHCTLKVTWTDWLAQPGWRWWWSHLLCVLWPRHPRECWPICCSKTAKIEKMFKEIKKQRKSH